MPTGTQKPATKRRIGRPKVSTAGDRTIYVSAEVYRKVAYRAVDLDITKTECADTLLRQALGMSA